jgi:putative ABC transport system permease protein
VKFWRRKQEERELDEELRFHLLQEEQLRRDRGQDPAGARRDFGNLALVGENTRQTWGWAALERTARDARFAFRLLRKSPAFAFTAIGVLALGIGATTAIFSVVNAVLLRPLGFPEPDRLVMVWERLLPGTHNNVIQTQNFLDWRARNQSFSRIACMFGLAMNLSGDGEPVQVPGMAVSAGFFEILGVPLVIGRVFTAADDVMGAPNVAILSYGLWQRRLGGRAEAIGRKLVIEGTPTEIIGVMPPEFAFPTIRADLYRPIRLNPATAPREGRNYQAVARLKAGVSLFQAQREMEAIAAQTARERPNMNTNWSAAVVPLFEQTVGKSRQTLLVLLAAVLFVLLIACANVSNLLLMRAAGRQREMTVRAALGAGRWRLLHQTAVESLLLALFGGVLGYLLAWWAVPAAVRMLPEGYPLPRRNEISVDSGVLWFSIAVSVLCGLFFGVFPALHVNRARLAEGLKQGGRTGSGTGRGLRNALVVAEVSVAVVLVVGAGLMFRSLMLLNSVNLGFQPDHVLTLRMMLLFSKYAGDVPRRAAVIADTLERIRALPQVKSASSIHLLPMKGMNSGTDYNRADRPAPPPGSGTGGEVSVVSDDYFRTMGIPLISGREFDRRTDRMGSPGVAIVNQEAAKLLFGTEDPIGKRIRIFWGLVKEPQIVGVAASMRRDSPDVLPQPTVYICNMQAPSLFASLVIRTQGHPVTAVAAVKEAMRQVDPDQGTAEIQSMEQLVSGSIAGPRLQAVLLGAFGALGLLLACVGIYAVISYSVAQRMREVGIRLALGAAPGAIRGMVLCEGMLLAAAGIAIGAAASLALTRYLATMLYTVKPTDPAVFASVAAILAVAAAAGCWFPAHRATSVDPAVVLREE